MDNSFDRRADHEDEVIYTGQPDSADEKPSRYELDAILSEKDRTMLSQFEYISIPLFFWKHIDGDFIFLGSNRFAAESTGNILVNYLGQKASRIYSGFPWILDELNRCLKEKGKSSRKLKYNFVIAGTKDLMATFIYVAPDIVMIHSEDITEKRRIQEELNRRLELVEVISSISSDLINPESRDFREVVEKSLKSVGEYIKVDQCSLTLYPGDKSDRDDVYIWQKPGFKKESAGIAITRREYPALFEKLSKLDKILITRSHEAVNKTRPGEEILDIYDLGSVLIVPAALNARLVGSLCFASSKSDLQLNEDTLALLRMLGESFASVYELAKTETALRSSEALYRDLVENVKEVVYSVDRHGIITYISPSVKTLGGYEPGELIGTSFDRFVYHEDIPLTLDNLYRYIAGHSEPMDIEIRLKIKSGEFIWTHISLKPIFSENGFMALRGILADITERKKAEEALKESEERYRAVWDNSPVGICLTDVNGVYRYVNPAYCRIYGHSEEAMIGHPFYEIIAPGVPSKSARANHNRIFAEGRALPLGVTEFVRKGGERIWIEYTADFVRKNDVPLYLVSMNVDITERKKAEMALKLSEEKYGIIIDNAAELIFSVEENGKVFLVNSMAARYLEGKPGDFSGRTIWDIFPRAIADKQMAVIRKVIKENSSDMREETIELNNEKRWFKTSVHPIYDHKAGIRAAQIIANDITEEKQKTFRGEARMKLLDELRSTDDINKCLQLGCDAIVDAELYKRSVFTLHDEDRNIEYLGQRGTDLDIQNAARNAPPPGNKFRDRLVDDKYKVSHSLFVPKEAEIDFTGEGRYIQQCSGENMSKSTWKDGDELLVPVIGDKNEFIGWLSVDGPVNGRRPDRDTIIFLEEIVDVVTQHIKEIQGRNKLSQERQMLKEKNVALLEVMAMVEKEKIGLKSRIIEDLDKAILPLLNRIVNNDKTINIQQIDLLRRNLENLVSSERGIIRNISKLSTRESQICEHIKNGATNQTIAKGLNISIATVKKHREMIRKKLGLKHKSINLATYLKST